MSLTNLVGNLCRSSTGGDTSTSIRVGDCLPVGKFFWIPREDFIGYDSDARHGHRLHGNGSVDVDCTLIVRGIKSGYAIVRLDRPRVIFVLPDPYVSVIQIPVDELD